ncbi:MAG: ABC transporter ATP-binding protein [Cuniculiplasma sp.]
MSENIISIKNLNITYQSYGRTNVAVRDFDMTIKRGEIVSLVGESGAGKSTVGKSIMGLIDPPGKVSGEILFNEKNLVNMSESKKNRYRWKKISMIFQASLNSLNPTGTIFSDFYSVFRDKLDIKDKKIVNQKIDLLLDSVNLFHEIKKSFPHELSGGMKQRIMIALALSTEPELVIADEPTTALDVVTEYYVLSLLKEKIKALGISMLYITHDLPSVIFMADKIVVMEKGVIVEEGKVRDVITNPSNPYTKMLVQGLVF